MGAGGVPKGDWSGSKGRNQLDRVLRFEGFMQLMEVVVAHHVNSPIPLSKADI